MEPNLIIERLNNISLLLQYRIKRGSTWVTRLDELPVRRKRVPSIRGVLRLLRPGLAPSAAYFAQYGIEIFNSNPEAGNPPALNIFRRGNHRPPESPPEEERQNLYQALRLEIQQYQFPARLSNGENADLTDKLDNLNITFSSVVLNNTGSLNQTFTSRLELYQYRLRNLERRTQGWLELTLTSVY